LSELLQGVQEGRFHKGNVYDLTIGTALITFQDQPKTKTSSLRGEPNVRHYYVNAVGMEDDKSRLTTLLATKGVDFSYAAPVPEWQWLLYVLCFRMMLVLFLLFLFRRIGRAGSAILVGRSRGKLFAQEDNEITFNEVAGIEEAVEELREVVEFLRTPGK